MIVSTFVLLTTKPGDGRRTPDDYRSNFFKDHLKRLAVAGSSGFDSLKQACEVTQSSIDNLYPSIATRSSQFQSLSTVPVHQYSKSILPHGWKHLLPLACYGDGNCLYR